MKSFLALLATLAACGASAVSIVPATPLANQPVVLRMTVDSCAFVPSTVRIDMVENVVRITQRFNNCFVAGAPEVVDVRLGSFPAGDYVVHLYGSAAAEGDPLERLAFRVSDPAEIAVFPPPPRPLDDYSGLWWNPLESGWGLAIHQGPTHTLFAMLFVYAGDSQPEWYTLQVGRWASSTTWTGTVYRTTGPGLASSVFDPGHVAYAVSGVATLDFKQRPGEEGIARFTYTINGVTATKSIRRLAL